MSTRDAAAATRHTPAMQDIYRRMLTSAGAQGRFVQRPSGRLVHVVTAGDGPPLVHLHGTNTSSLSHLMLPGLMPGNRSYLVDRPGCGLSDPDSYRAGHFRGYAVEFVGDMLDALGLGSGVLVGASGGGPGPPGSPWHTRSGSAGWSCSDRCRCCLVGWHRCRCDLLPHL